MSAELIRHAADRMREDNRHDAATGDYISATLVEVAAWLVDYAVLIEELGHPIAFTDHALVVAETYLGGEE